MFTGSAPHLGVEIGVETHRRQWTNVVPRLLQRGRDIAVAGAITPTRVVAMKSHYGRLVRDSGFFVQPDSLASDFATRQLRIHHVNNDFFIRYDLHPFRPIRAELWIPNGSIVAAGGVRLAPFLTFPSPSGIAYPDQPMH